MEVLYGELKKGRLLRWRLQRQLLLGREFRQKVINDFCRSVGSVRDFLFGHFGA